MNEPLPTPRELQAQIWFLALLVEKHLTSGHITEKDLRELRELHDEAPLMDPSVDSGARRSRPGVPTRRTNCGSGTSSPYAS